MIITIDGPAGAGKSTITKILANKLAYDFLDTGAMYRVVAYLLKKTKYSQYDLEEFLNNLKIIFNKQRIIANDIDVTDFIRTSEIDLYTSEISTIPLIREKMCLLQRQVACNTNIVAEGRDMGSHVFPNAEYKFYLDANSIVRAKRRRQQLLEKNIVKDLNECEKEIIHRDKADFSRKCNPLCIPLNACIIDTSYLTVEEVLQKMLQIINNC